MGVAQLLPQRWGHPYLALVRLAVGVLLRHQNANADFSTHYAGNLSFSQ